MQVSASRKMEREIRDDIKVHCHCRMPEMKGTAMIECTSCLKLFHVVCVKAPTKNTKDEWFCQSCTALAISE